jgi:hypothetical protein
LYENRTPWVQHVTQNHNGEETIRSVQKQLEGLNESHPYLCTEYTQTNRLSSTVSHLGCKKARIWVVLSPQVNTNF